MTVVHDRARRREKAMADALGTARTRYRGRYERAPDAVPFRLTSGPGAGLTVVPESKSRKALPKWVTESIAQARRYLAGAVPLVVIAELGGEQLAVLPLRDFARIAGIQGPKANEQLVLGRSA